MNSRKVLINTAKSAREAPFMHFLKAIRKKILRSIKNKGGSV